METRAAHPNGVSVQGYGAPGRLILLVGLYTGWLGWQGIQQAREVHASALMREVRG
jgi:hypothetical protein